MTVHFSATLHPGKEQGGPLLADTPTMIRMNSNALNLIESLAVGTQDAFH